MKNVKMEHHHCILHIRTSLGTKFQLKLTSFDFLDQICPKRVFLVKNGKSEHHHSSLHIRIRLGSKFQLKLTILIFQTKFSQKGYLPSKTEKWHFCVRLLSLFTILNFFARESTSTTAFQCLFKDYSNNYSKKIIQRLLK